MPGRCQGFSQAGYVVGTSDVPRRDCVIRVIRMIRMICILDTVIWSYESPWAGNVRRDGPAGVDGAVTKRQKGEEDSGGFWLSFFDTQQRPNPRWGSILVGPTVFAGSMDGPLFGGLPGGVVRYWSVQRFWVSVFFFNGLVNGSGGVSDLFFQWFAQRGFGIQWSAQRVWRGFGFFSMPCAVRPSRVAKPVRASESASRSVTETDSPSN